MVREVEGCVWARVSWLGANVSELGSLAAERTQPFANEKEGSSKTARGASCSTTSSFSNDLWGCSTAWPLFLGVGARRLFWPFVDSPSDDRSESPVSSRDHKIDSAVRRGSGGRRSSPPPPIESRQVGDYFSRPLVAARSHRKDGEAEVCGKHRQFSSRSTRPRGCRARRPTRRAPGR